MSCSKSLYRSSAGRHFYGTENVIWAGFGPIGNTAKLNVVGCVLKSCIISIWEEKKCPFWSCLMFPRSLNYQTKGLFSYTKTPTPKGYSANHFFTQNCYFKPFSHRLDSASSRKKWLSFLYINVCTLYKAEFDWKSSGYLTKRAIACDEGVLGKAMGFRISQACWGWA